MKKYNLKKTLAVIAALTLCCSAAGCSKNNDSSAEKTSSLTSIADSDISAEDLDVGYSETDACKITLNGTGAEIGGDGASAEKGTVTISKAGTYMLSGSLSDGRIIVSADKKSEIKLVFNGIDISCSDNAPIYVEKAKKVYITLEDGSENILKDGKEYSLGENDSNVDGAIFSKADLTINGMGKLDITSSYKHALVCKDNLVITDGNYKITAASSGIVGKDSVKISGGTFDISAEKNGIKSTNDKETDKGYISITGGTFTLNAGGDGLQAETALSVEGGTFTLTTGGGSANASMKSDGKPNENWQNDMRGGPMGDPPSDMGNPPSDMGTPPDKPDNGDAIQNTADKEMLQKETNESNDSSADTSAEKTDSSASAKALKAGTAVNISGGEFTIDSADDSIHSNGTINITGGKIKASSGDDGIHGDSDVVIDNGEITISKSYEGIEGMTVTINGGTINVTASDDGINCAGGSDTGSTDRAGMDMFTPQEGVYLKITGGTIVVDASGDGLDSNGDLYIEGGTTYVYGPTSNGDGALDYDGNATVSGGTLAAFGSAGMAQGFGSDSTQYSFLHNLSSTVDSGKEVTITNADGKELLKCTPAKQWQSVVFTCADLADGETYTIKSNDTSESVTLSGIATSNGQSGFGGGMGGGMGRR